MATASLPQDPDLDQLRNRARELQRAVRRGEPAALTMVSRWHPDPPPAGRFPLTAAQLVLARQHGFASWARMRRYVQVVTARAWTPGQQPPGDESPADRFLRLACLTYSRDQSADRAAAAELLAGRPGLPAENLFTAAACADVAQVRRHLAGRPAGASMTGGPHGWSPLLYLAYARHDPNVGLSATLETARLLLDAGADPNDGRFWHALPSPFTVLTGVLGYGEHRQLRHPHAIPFARLLLERGADPNDGQTLYNRMFGSDDDHLVLLFEYGLGGDTRGPWRRLLGESLESPAEMLRSVSDLLSDPQLSRVRGMVLGVWFPFGGGGVGVPVEARAECRPACPVGVPFGFRAGRAHALVPGCCAGQRGPGRSRVSLRTLAAAPSRAWRGGCRASPGRAA